MRKYIIFLLIILLCWGGCGKSSKIKLDAIREIKKPSYLLITKEISGVIIGDKLNQPYGAASDIKGKIFISDYGNDRLLLFSQELNPLDEIGGFGKTAGLFNHPTYISFDNGLNLMVSDESNRRINRYNSQFVYVDEIPFYDFEDPQKFGYPAGIAFSDYGEAWIVDREYNHIAVFSNVGLFDRYVGDYGYSGGQLNSPEKIITDKNNDFIVCDAGNSRLMVYDRFGNFQRAIENKKFDYPISVISGDNYIWVLDGANGKMYLLGSDNQIIFETGPSIPGSTIALKEPSDFIELGENTFLITDTGNNRILVCRVVFE